MDQVVTYYIDICILCVYCNNSYILYVCICLDLKKSFINPLFMKIYISTHPKISYLHQALKHFSQEHLITHIQIHLKIT